MIEKRRELERNHKQEGNDEIKRERLTPSASVWIVDCRVDVPEVNFPHEPIDLRSHGLESVIVIFWRGFERATGRDGTYV